MATHQHGQDWYTDTECPCTAGKPADPDWILTAAVTAVKLRDGHYLIQEVRGQGRQCLVTFAGERMLFNGQDVEVEEHMAYVGLLDQVDQAGIGHELFCPPEPAW